MYSGNDSEPSNPQGAASGDWNYESTGTNNGAAEFLDFSHSSCQQHGYPNSFDSGGRARRNFGQQRYAPPEQFFRYRSPQRGRFQDYRPSSFSRTANNRFGSPDNRGFQRPRGRHFNQRGSFPNHRQQYHGSTFPYFHPSMLEDPWAPFQSKPINKTTKHEIPIEVANDDPELQEIMKQMQERKEAESASADDDEAKKSDLKPDDSSLTNPAEEQSSTTVQHEIEECQ